jgi:hypothetical protein
LSRKKRLLEWTLCNVRASAETQRGRPKGEDRQQDDAIFLLTKVGMECMLDVKGYLLLLSRKLN